MKPSLRQQFERLALRLGELDALLADGSVAADMKRYRELGREHADAAALVDLFRRYEGRERDLGSADQLLAESADDEAMAAMAREESQAAAADLERLLAEVQAALLPRDPDDTRNVFLEIRAGTGGDESALFAADLARMYLRFAERKRWRTEIISESASDLGGYKELVVRIEGELVYAALKFESGGHRVQRVPVTETQGRIHTSACTVAVLPEADEAEEVTLDPSELRIDTFRASGAGGQHVNKTDSAIRITHLPTGIVAECQDDRSQHRNKAKALAVLTARLRDKDRSERAAKEAATRKGLIGSGDRSDRIRTYNFAQGRVTDHRIGLTLYKLQAILDGDLGEVIAALQAAQAAEQLAMLESGEGLMATVAAALAEARARGVERLDAQLMLAAILGVGRSALIAHEDRPLPSEAEARWAGWLERRATGEPLAYLLGTKEFHGLEVEVNAAVLVPRPETELLVDWGLELLAATPGASLDAGEARTLSALDLGTGSGAIALALKHARPTLAVSASDVSAEALAVARRNTDRLGLAIELVASSWWQSLARRRFDLVVSNPPYIAAGDRHLAALHHEPQAALTPGGDGLDAIRAIAGDAWAHLHPGGWLLIEHGFDQGPAVRALLERAGLAGIATRTDLAGHPRATAGSRPAPPS